MTHVTCRLTAKNRDRLRNPVLGNRVRATFTFFYVRDRPKQQELRGTFPEPIPLLDACGWKITYTDIKWVVVSCSVRFSMRARRKIGGRIWTSPDRFSPKQGAMLPDCRPRLLVAGSAGGQQCSGVASWQAVEWCHSTDSSVAAAAAAAAAAAGDGGALSLPG